ncbi:hypothetical protein ERJ75_001769600 [Trypanosoma vivax]|nr:hypothetical protein TRVL_07839 [Trypanosoma vivax]KAH8604045.1 hypothetical protein ERJ75_001769600 [Trypanosoma vivax]
MRGGRRGYRGAGNFSRFDHERRVAFAEWPVAAQKDDDPEKRGESAEIHEGVVQEPKQNERAGSPPVQCMAGAQNLDWRNSESPRAVEGAGPYVDEGKVHKTRNSMGSVGGGVEVRGSPQQRPITLPVIEALELEEDPAIDAQQHVNACATLITVEENAQRVRIERMQLEEQCAISDSFHSAKARLSLRPSRDNSVENQATVEHGCGEKADATATEGALETVVTALDAHSSHACHPSATPNNRGSDWLRHIWKPILLFIVLFLLRRLRPLLR